MGEDLRNGSPMDEAVIKDIEIRDMEPADADIVAGFIREVNVVEAAISADRDLSQHCSSISSGAELQDRKLRTRPTSRPTSP